MVDSSAAMSDPSGATSTTRALAPLSCGKRCSNASSALCACVPGISKVDCREPPSAVESVPAPTATTSQAAITHQRKRATNRPSRYRYVDTVCHPPGDRKSTRLNSVTNEPLVCRLLLEKKKHKKGEKRHKRH